jgi:hypothetical protein
VNIDPKEPLERRIRRLKVESYLEGLHCTLWPDAAFDLTDEKERAQAVAFLEEIVDSL